MKIQLGIIKMNKTKKYLLPCLKEYGSDFEERFKNLFKLAVGIGDFALSDMGFTLETHIFILVDTNLSRRTFNSTINWLRLQDYYQTDYPFDDLHNGHKHMIVVKLPENFYDSMSKFKRGQFSEMYTFEDLQRLFINKDSEIKVLTKNKDYMVEFVDKVNDIYKTTVQPEEWEGELEFPILPEEETF